MESNGNGTFELKGYTEKQLKGFSQRRAQVLDGAAKEVLQQDLREELQRQGVSFVREPLPNEQSRFVVGVAELPGLKLVQVSVGRFEVRDFVGDKSFAENPEPYLARVDYKKTRVSVTKQRSAKGKVSLNDLRKEWQLRADVLGISHPNPQKVLQEEVSNQSKVDVAWVTEHLAERKTSWKESQFLATALEHHMGLASFAEVKRAVEDAKGVVELPKKSRKEMAAVKTLAFEEQCRALEKFGRGKHEAVLSAEQAQDVATTQVFTRGQADAFRLITTSKNQYSAAMGVAGSGKSYALKSLLPTLVPLRWFKT